MMVFLVVRVNQITFDQQANDILNDSFPRGVCMNWLTVHAAQLNLGASALNFITGALLFMNFRRKSQKVPEYLEHVSLLWICQWAGFLLIYVFLASVEDRRLALAVTDIPSLMAIAMSLVLIRAEPLRAQDILNVAILAVVLMGWAYMWGDPKNLTEVQRRMWVFASETMSAMAYMLLSFAMFRRYGMAAVSFVSLAIGYLIVQRPVYEQFFVHLTAVVGGWVLAAAVGKLLVAVSFYGLLFTSTKSDLPIPLLPLPSMGPVYQRFAAGSVALITGIVTTIVSTMLVHYMQGLLK